MDFVPAARERNVPDPYYTGAFDTVYEMVREGSQSLLEHIREKEGI
jgi:protein-tyrosine phosphatase